MELRMITSEGMVTLHPEDKEAVFSLRGAGHRT